MDAISIGTKSLLYLVIDNSGRHVKVERVDLDMISSIDQKLRAPLLNMSGDIAWAVVYGSCFA